MKKINESARSIDVVLETDVLVVGRRPRRAWAAALAAARARRPQPPSSTVTAVSAAISLRSASKALRGYRHETHRGLRRHRHRVRGGAPKPWGAAMPEPQSLSHALDAEMFKWVADMLVQEAGVTPLLHRLGVAPIMENGVIQGV